MRATGLALLLAATALATGCARTQGAGYYWQSVTGHVDLMWRARPVDDWLADEGTPAALRQRLELARRLRAFAVSELALPDNASYHRYADLERNAAVYNVVAAPPLSLTLQTWCFPVAGCVGYRGYYREADARAFAASLGDELEVGVYPVPAYSTLGWMNWAGGDPLLNTFIRYPEGELARLLFHELAHQVLYAKDDTGFNESFATAVERIGVQRWFAQASTPAARVEYEAFDQRRRAFRALTASVRERLQVVYGDATLDDAAKRVRKAQVMADFRREYEALKAFWGGFAAYDPWVARANNALLGAQGAYDQLVPGFEALFEREGRDFTRFYDAVRTLAALPKEERHQRLQALAITR
ncbi:MAG: aminopeptidase [Hydrogenophaga sp.]|uniref:aminopeptidase n=1 Tax=Hydrogenophaga sp. TaxID=1904254 RepID=UPI0016B748B2|nr:aminopeptidase [Hydrogenophaga sp.]NIM40517.1 aminopeptidase [Hydrogenophaga sp.]NIN25935.1 aminopeptidase [Hydrogenophaga sp.]NIN30807.1 aminopeptidase [Hydrogenophaga sp.]NIN54900.1 aminopeptidase [Hydrogenophaga sp.]NIO50940.1 aminopeptidase [Hydrogenophaga sp.]